MLETLHISNYALIDDLTIEFRPGLNVITGSTGAGKTIIFGALGLALGERVSDEVIRTGAGETSVETVFTLRDSKIPPFEGFDISDNLIIRREIKRDGRGRAFANNRQITLQNLKLIGAELADIVGQHRQKGLTDPSTHRQILDQFAGLQSELEELSELHRQYYKLSGEYLELKNKQEEAESEKELLSFQIKEIEAASLTEDEDIAIQEEKLKLVNAEKIKSSCRICLDVLFDEDGSAFERFGNALKEIERLGKFGDQAVSIREKLDELSAGLDETGSMLRDFSDSFEFDPERLEIIEERIVLINKFKRKYGQTIVDIIAYCEQAKIKLESFENLDDQIKDLSEKLKLCRQLLSEKAAIISKKRHDAAGTLEKVVIRHLGDLAMKGSDFRVDFNYTENPDGPFAVDKKILAGDEHGYDKIEFLICPNPGEQLKPLATTASGGELSRILLAISSALVDIMPKSTLVFDEIDSGISGEVAFKVGRKLNNLARSRQVICITHLQQLASLGEAHFKVYKGKDKGRSVTRIKLLEGDQRVAEIARLLAGERISDVALDGAARLLEEGRN